MNQLKKFLILALFAVLALNSWADAMFFPQLMSYNVYEYTAVTNEQGSLLMSSAPGDIAKAVEDGTISTGAFGNTVDLSTIIEMGVYGPVNAADLAALQQAFPNLAYLSMENAQIVDDEGNEDPTVLMTVGNPDFTAVKSLALPAAFTEHMTSEYLIRFPNLEAATATDVENATIVCYSNVPGTLHKALQLTTEWRGSDEWPSDITNWVMKGEYGGQYYEGYNSGNTSYGHFLEDFDLMANDNHGNHANVVNLDMSQAVCRNYTDFELNGARAPIEVNTSMAARETETNALHGISFFGKTLETVLLPETDETTLLPFHALYHCEKVTELNIPQNITTLGDECCLHMSGLTSLSADGVTEMNIGVFAGCESLTEVQLPSGLTNVSPYAFSESVNVKELVLPEGLEVIEEYAFDYIAIETIHLPSSLKRIEEHAFDENENLLTITFPEGLEFIGEGAFFNCQHLRDVYFLGTTSPTVPRGAFDGTSTYNDDGVTTNSEGHIPPRNMWDVREYLDWSKYDWSTQTWNTESGTWEVRLPYDMTQDCYGWTDWDGADGGPGGAAIFHFPEGCEDQYTDDARNKAYNCINSDGRRWPSHEDMRLYDVRFQAGEQMYAPDGHEITGLVDFILVFPMAPQEYFEIPHIYDDTWYTLCMPMNVSGLNMKATFNPGFELCDFTSVIIDWDTYDKPAILLNFNTRVDEEQGLVANHPYMIHPNSGASPEATSLAGRQTTFTITGGEWLPAEEWIPEVVSVPVWDFHKGDTEYTMPSAKYPNAHYDFVGSYDEKRAIPKGNYFLGLKPGDVKYPKYFRENKEIADEDVDPTKTGQGRWTPYTATVYPSLEVEKDLFPSEHADEQTTGVNGMDVIFDAVAVEADGIDEILENAKKQNQNVQYFDVIYNINGQRMKAGTDLHGMPSGLYIVNGKKYLVK